MRWEMPERSSLPAGSIYLPPEAGRVYEMGAMRAVFKADGVETGDRYCVSEWWLDPHTQGPGAHQHEANDEVFYVLEGTPSMLIGADWVDAPAGSFMLIPHHTHARLREQDRSPRRIAQLLHPRRLRADDAVNREMV